MNRPLFNGVFNRVWIVDTEYRKEGLDQLEPRCLVAIELYTKQQLLLWHDELVQLTALPFNGAGNLVVCHNASAECEFLAAYGFKSPENIIDTYIEFKNYTNGLDPITSGCRFGGLLDCLRYFNLRPRMEKGTKDYGRELSMQNKRSNDYTREERRALLRYCLGDVLQTCDLALHMERIISRHLGLALIRGRYMSVVASMHIAGVPIDQELWRTMLEHWGEVRLLMIQSVKDFNVYKRGQFNPTLFTDYLKRRRMKWPLTPKGQPKRCRDTFEKMTEIYPEIKPLAVIRRLESQCRRPNFKTGKDGRNRPDLWPFATTTSRHAYRGSVFQAGSWMRGLIKPEPGRGLIYADFVSQEYLIAAALSDDAGMLECYQAGDIYMHSAIMAGAAPPGATKETHGEARKVFKTITLGLQYGMSPEGLARKLNCAKSEGLELYEQHKQLFPAYWRWIEGRKNLAFHQRYTVSKLGWRRRVWSKDNPRSIANHPIQTTGADCLRVSAIYAAENDIQLVMPVHDALVAESSLESLDRAAKTLEMCMIEGFRDVVGQMPRIDVRTIRYPDNFLSQEDDDGPELRTWRTFLSCLEKAKTKAPDE